MQHPGLIMNIRKWLAETEHPVLSERPVVEPFLLPRQPDLVPDARRRRKRSSTDSSLLKVPLPQPRGKGLPAIERDHRHVQNAANRAYSEMFHPTHNELASNSTTSKCYTRRPRHKTRPDRYEAGTKKDKRRDGNSRPDRKSEARKSKHKSRRSKVGNTRNGIRQKSHAENVSQDRLTLKPLGKTGLFSKGKASTTARGSGLPDLVFSKMGFLQNNRVENEHSAQVPDAKKKRKRDHTQTKEGDISAFFTSVRPAQIDVAANRLANDGRPRVTPPATKADRGERAREESTVLDPAVRTVNSEEGASCLGSVSSRPDSETSSYFSWSESDHAASTTPGHRKRTSPVHAEGPGPLYQERAKGPHREVSLRQPETSSLVREPTFAATEEARWSSVDSAHSGCFRSRSLPQRSSLARQSISADQVLHRCMTENESLLSSKSPLLRPPDDVAAPEHHVTNGSRRVRSDATSCGNESEELAQKRPLRDAVRPLMYRPNPQKASSLGRILQYCNDAFRAEGPHTALRRTPSTDTRFSPSFRDTVRQPRQRAQVPTVQHLAPDSQLPQPLNFSGPGLYAQQEQRQHLLMPFGSEEEYRAQDLNTVGRGYKSESGFSIQEDVERFSGEPVSYGSMEESNADGGGVVGLDRVVDEVEQVQRLGSVDFVASGFWRPNRLY